MAEPGDGVASDVNIDFGSAFSKIDPSVYKFVEIRMAGFLGDRIDFFYSNTTTGATAVSFDASSDGNMHTYLIDLSADAGWLGTLDLLRLDPTVSGNVTFEIDYVRFYATAVVPEQSHSADGTHRRPCADHQQEAVTDSGSA